MKLLKKSAIAICLLASVATNAQYKDKSSSKKSSYAINDAIEEFKSKNPGIKSIDLQPGGVITIQKTNGKVEKYYLNKFDSKKNLEKLYGSLAPLPPVPPPPPPTPPTPLTEVDSKNKPEKLGSVTPLPMVPPPPPVPATLLAEEQEEI